MSFSKNYITQKGLALNASLIHEGKLNITRVIGAYQTKPSGDVHDLTNVGTPIIAFQTNQGVVYDRDSSPNRITIPIYYKNDQMAQSKILTEIAVFAEDPEDGEILYCLMVGYDYPISIPAATEASLEITMDIIVELTLSQDTTITLPPSLVFLTKEEAVTLFAPKKHRHQAVDVDETVGATVEAHQRVQDAEIEALKAKTDTGTTSGETVGVNVENASNWRIIDYWGFYDKTTSTFRA